MQLNGNANPLSDDELLQVLGGTDASNIIPLESAPKPAASPAGRINFGGLKEKPKATGNTQYPVLPDDDKGTAAALADEFLKHHEAETAAKGAKEVARGQLVRLASPFHWKHNAGLAEIAGTVSVKSVSGKEVLVQFKNAYKAITDLKDKSGNVITPVEDRIKALPPEVFTKYFRESFVLEVDSSKIPEDKLQAVVDRIQAVANELGVQDAVAVAACFKPVESFHTDRYRILTPEQNQAIETAMGEKGLLTVAVTAARGRKK